ncbi:MAG: hypothetical protein P4M11_13040 [Candidatus Pacebacteria bacterium]|nr:hypothetical protein [Candidatus Paceibacterota bacterium]
MKLYIPMYFEVFDEICEYVVWSKQHSRALAKSFKPAEKFYMQNMTREIKNEFSLLEVGVVNLYLSVLFNESLVYLFHFEDTTNVPNCQLNTPFVLRRSERSDRT